MSFAPPELKIREYVIRQMTNVTLEESPYNFKQARYDWMGGKWGLSLTLAPPKTRKERAAVEGWLLGLNGPLTKFELPHLDYEGPYGVADADGSIAVSASEATKTITVQHVARKYAGGAFGDLGIGDMVTLSGHLHGVTNINPVNGSGLQVIDIWPRLRSDITASDPVQIIDPYGSWSLAKNENGWGSNLKYWNMSLELIEAF